MTIRARTVLAAATALAIALPLLAAERLAVKTGLWQNTVTTEITGVQLPAEQVRNMTPEQRARLDQVMKQMGIGAPSTSSGPACILEQDLDGNAFRNALEQAGQQCEYQEVAATPQRQEWTFHCRIEGGEATGRMLIDVLSDSRVRGSMQASLPQAKMDMKFDAQWQAASCGNVE